MTVLHNVLTAHVDWRTNMSDLMFGAHSVAQQGTRESARQAVVILDKSLSSAAETKY